jgi:protocatechuate 3,4-dioxygenase beta subunit
VAAGEVRRDVSLSGAGQLEGRVADQAGRPIAGAAITLTDARGEVVATAVTTDEGTYTLPDLYPADYTLTATSEGTRPAARTVSLGAGGDNRVDIVLVTNGTLAGVIRAAASGQPVPDASVLAVDQYGTVVGATVTGPDGRYEFPDLQPGAYTVTASGYAPVASRVQLAGDRTDHDILLGTPPSPTNGTPANGRTPHITAFPTPAQNRSAGLPTRSENRSADLPSPDENSGARPDRASYWAPAEDSATASDRAGFPDPAGNGSAASDRAAFPAPAENSSTAPDRDGSPNSAGDGSAASDRAGFPAPAENGGDR